MSRIISFSSDDSFSDGLENTIAKSGYKNRSRFMRDAVLHFADYKQRGELESMDEDEFIEGHLIIYYQHGVESKLMELRHSHELEVFSFHHNCLTKSHSCVDTLQLSGTAKSLRSAMEKLNDIRDVDKVEFVSAPLRDHGCC